MDRQKQVEQVIAHLSLPPGVVIRAWVEADFAAIQQLSNAEGWLTPVHRPEDSLEAWKASWPTLVATQSGQVVGFLRALTDGYITIYVAEVVVASSLRGKGIGAFLLKACHLLFPDTRTDLLSTDGARPFYEREGFTLAAGYRKRYS